MLNVGIDHLVVGKKKVRRANGILNKAESVRHVKSNGRLFKDGNKYSIPIYTQQDTLHSLFYLETALRVSGGTSTHHQERKQLYLQHLVFVRPLLLPAAIGR